MFVLFVVFEVRHSRCGVLGCRDCVACSVYPLARSLHQKGFVRLILSGDFQVSCCLVQVFHDWKTVVVHFVIDAVYRVDRLGCHFLRIVYATVFVDVFKGVLDLSVEHAFENGVERGLPLLLIREELHEFLCLMGAEGAYGLLAFVERNSLGCLFRIPFPVFQKSAVLHLHVVLLPLVIR